jgi:hypothetical protein
MFVRNVTRHMAECTQETAGPPVRPAQETFLAILYRRSTIIFIAARAMFYWACTLKHHKICPSGVAAWGFKRAF